MNSLVEEFDEGVITLDLQLSRGQTSDVACLAGDADVDIGGGAVTIASSVACTALLCTGGKVSLVMITNLPQQTN